jgi:hypothetical protein
MVLRHYQWDEHRSYVRLSSKNGCSYHPQKGMLSNAAFHSTIETVGFQTAFSVKRDIPKSHVQP